MPKTRSMNVLSAIAVTPVWEDSPVRARFHLQAIDLAKREGLGQAMLCYAVLPLDAPATGVLHVGGEAFHAPHLLPETGALTALAFGAATLGSALERRVTELFSERQRSLALALDGLGNRMLIEVSRRLQDIVLATIQRMGLDMAGELRPGDPGLQLDAQPAVLRLAGAAGLGLRTTHSFVLDPTKSVTVVYGVGRELPPASWSRCDDCRSRPKCRMARMPAVTVPT